MKRIDLEISRASTGHDVAEDFPGTISGGQMKGQPNVIWGQIAQL